jgi:hypothetical protein
MERWALPVVAMMVALAGCSGSAGGKGGDDPPGGGGVPVTVTDDTGAVRGVVVDDSIVPIVGAVVELAGTDQSMETNEAGAFGFSEIEPGTYFLRVTKNGYFDAQQSVEVEAGVPDPPLVKVQLQADPEGMAFFTVQVWEGYIECTTSFIAVCGAPNVVSNVLLCPVFDICLGNVTNDRFGQDIFYPENASAIQSEMFWESTQSLSTQLTLSLENIAPCEAESNAYIEGATGDSPIFVHADAEEIERGTVGGDCPMFHSVFSGDTQGTPLGATIQQDFMVISHGFWGFTPPEGWRYSVDGDPVPPA